MIQEMFHRRAHRGSCSNERGGFTLIETLVAISLLTMAIVAPVTLTNQSLQSAYYARDQITAFYLAQEAVEAIRALRDNQILLIATSGNASGINLFGNIPSNDQPFTVDAHRLSNPSQEITDCSSPTDPSSCPPLQTNGVLYGYAQGESGWTNTNFTRWVVASYVPGSSNNEIRVTATVTWKSAAFATRSFSLSENLYRWVQDGSAAP